MADRSAREYHLTRCDWCTSTAAYRSDRYSSLLKPLYACPTCFDKASVRIWFGNEKPREVVLK